MNRQQILIACTLALAVFLPSQAQAGAYNFTSNPTLFGQPATDIVLHPPGYLPNAGTPPTSFTVNVCIVPGSPFQNEMVIPTQNVVDRFNLLVPSFPNIRYDQLTVFGNIDFESVAVHEMGHCNGLAHVNAASESGLPSAEAESTKAQTGTNGTLNTGAGVDTFFGSPDDIRDDDVNLHYFEKGVNNPFLLPDKVDSTTYSRNLADLPGSHVFAANADREVAANVFGVVSDDCQGGINGSERCVEAVMQQGSSNGETQRALAADDAAILMFARTGIDRIVGNADDYVPTLNYAGVSSASTCDIKISFNNAETGFAVCKFGVSSGNFNSGASALALSSGSANGPDMYFNTGSNWEFSTTRIPLPVADTAAVMAGGTVTQVNGSNTSLLANDTDQNAAAGCNAGGNCILSTSNFGAPKNGNVTLNANGTFSYTNTNTSATQDRFVYEVCVGTDTSACAHQFVTITITPADIGLIFKNGFE